MICCKRRKWHIRDADSQFIWKKWGLDAKHGHHSSWLHLSHSVITPIEGKTLRTNPLTFQTDKCLVLFIHLMFDLVTQGHLPAQISPLCRPNQSERCPSQRRPTKDQHHIRDRNLTRLDAANEAHVMEVGESFIRYKYYSLN